MKKLYNNENNHIPDAFVESPSDRNLLLVYWFTRLLVELSAEDSNRFMVDQKRKDLATGKNGRDEHVEAVA